MNKIRKTIALIMTFVISLTIICGNLPVAYAQSKDTISIAKDSQIPLYNEADEIVAYHFTLQNGGYLITTADGSDFIEYCLYSNNINIDKNKKYYYSSPCSLYIEINNTTIQNCYTKEKHKKNDISFNIQAPRKQNKKAATSLANSFTYLSTDSTSSLITTSSTYSTTDEKKLTNPTKKYKYNPDGRCGSVACAILLRYYNDYVNTNYLASKFETSDGKKLINYLTDNYIKKETTYYQLRTRLNNYLKGIGVSSRLKSIEATNSTTVYNKIKSYIKKNRPLIVGLNNHPKYGCHWVIGTGYSQVYNDVIGYGYSVIVNDGWGNTNVHVNLKYVSGCHYLT